MRIMESEPLYYADKLLEMLCDRFNVVIASHRRKESYDLLVDWLEQYNMNYDSIHISYDKTILFKSNIKYIIDDSPITMDAAIKNGICTIGLKYPWNICMKHTSARIENSLKDVYDFIKFESEKYR